MGEPIPGKGELLTQMALFWFEQLKHMVPNHLTGDDPGAWWSRRRARAGARPLDAGQAPEAAAGRGGRARLPGRQRLEGIPGRRGSVCGVPLPPGLKNARKLPEPIFTPADQGRGGRPRREHRLRARGEMIGAELAAGARHRDPPLQDGGGDRAAARASSSPTPSSSSASTPTAR